MSRGVARPGEGGGGVGLKFSEVFESNRSVYRTVYSTSPQNVATERIHVPENAIW
jgi:hypothetical protein